MCPRLFLELFLVEGRAFFLLSSEAALVGQVGERRYREGVNKIGYCKRILLVSEYDRKDFTDADKPVRGREYKFLIARRVCDIK